MVLTYFKGIRNGLTLLTLIALVLSQAYVVVEVRAGRPKVALQGVLLRGGAAAAGPAAPSLGGSARSRRRHVLVPGGPEANGNKVHGAEDRPALRAGAGPRPLCRKKPVQPGSNPSPAPSFSFGVADCCTESQEGFATVNKETVRKDNCSRAPDTPA